MAWIEKDFQRVVHDKGHALVCDECGAFMTELPRNTAISTSIAGHVQFTDGSLNCLDFCSPRCFLAWEAGHKGTPSLEGVEV